MASVHLTTEGVKVLLLATSGERIAQGNDFDVLTAVVGTLSINGVTAYLVEPNVLMATPGQLSIAGIECTIAEGTPPAEVITASPGQLSIAGRTAYLIEPETLVAITGALSIAGIECTIEEGVAAATDETGFNFENSVASDVGKAITMTNSDGLGYDTGISGQALDFDGSGKLESSDSLFIEVDDETIHMMVWVKLQNTGQNHGVAGQNTSQYNLHILSNGVVRWRMNADILNSPVSEIADTTNWYHIEAVYDSDLSQMELYVNGTEVANSPRAVASPPAPATNPFTLGSISAGNLANLLMDSFKFKRGSRFSASEVSDHYNSGAGADV